MRPTVLMLSATLSLLATGSLTVDRAQAVTLAAPAGLAAASDATGLIEKVNCGWRWRCGRRGCGWRWTCWGGPYLYSYSYPYYGRSYFYARPYYWRHRHWRRW